jgi:ubiquinone/menaquinone biosynthesis C-methylase UbiE
LTYLEKAADAGLRSSELDYWRAAALARVGRIFEASILVTTSDTKQQPVDSALKKVLDDLAVKISPDDLRYEEIAASVDAVDGWLVEGQEKYLFEKVKSLPDNAVIIEIGSYHGRSTVAMAYACWGTGKRIFAIDTFLGNTKGGSRTKGNSYFDVWERNIHRRGLGKYVTPLPGYSHERLTQWPPDRAIDFAFIDASHLYKDVFRELELVYPFVKNGGWIALHDVDPGWPGPWRVWQETAMPLLESHEYSSTLACGRKRNGKTIERPKDPDRYDYSRSWVETLRTQVPQLACAMEHTFESLPFSNPEMLSAAEDAIATMPDHPLLRFALREMIKLEAGCDPYLHYWNALTYLHENQKEEAVRALGLSLEMGPPDFLKARIEQLLSTHGTMEVDQRSDAVLQPAEQDAPSIVFINTYYPKFLKRYYADHPEAVHAPYAQQLMGLVEQRFGDSDFYSTGMKRLGWRAQDLIVNCDPIQRAWARENNFNGQGLNIAVEQIRQLQPQVVYMQDLSLATTEFLRHIRPHTELIVGQIASPLPANADTNGLDIIFSSFPHFVERFRHAGKTAYYQPLAFDPSVLGAMDVPQRIHDVTFVGGLSPAHGKGMKILQQVSALVPVSYWGYGAESLPPGSPIRDRHNGEVWGLDMFKTLAASRITLNRHIDVAENYANNMRLFEATGCGALLITDYKDNLNELFEIGKEIVAYRTPEECAALVRYYQANPQEAGQIARRGQQRTLREHTYELRMQQTAEILERHLRYRRQTVSAPDLSAISCGHQTIKSDQVTERMTRAWQDESIPKRQRALVQQELMDMYRGAPPQVYQVIAEALRATVRNGSSILEIGCASGYYSEVIEYMLNCRIAYTGVDYSEALIAMARDYYSRQEFHTADGANLPFDAQSFNVVVSSAILMHVPNYQEHIAETIRVAQSHILFHRTPVCRQQPTRYMKKQAYGIETVELCFNETELLNIFVGHGLKLKGYIEYVSEMASDRYEISYIVEKKESSGSVDHLNDQHMAVPYAHVGGAAAHG